MKKPKKMRKITYAIICLIAALCMGCGGGASRNDAGNYYYYPQEESESTEFAVEREEERELFALVSIDYVDEVIHVYRYANGLEYQYYYGLNTGFYDKYGNLTSAANFVPGTVVYLGRTDAEGKLRDIQIADSVWKYGDVSCFSVDEEKGIFEIAGTNYNYDEETFVFSDEERIQMSDLSEQDLLTVIGKDKKILSVMVTTGHGELQLLNTALFEGSFLQLDTDYFAIITTNMNMEIPEGTYTLAVANDGWGGTCQVDIVRGETTTVDLDELKGEGPKYGMIVFDVDVEDAEIEVDHEPVAKDTPISLKYGWHSLTVSAEGFADWKKKLYVNSAEATVYIELEEESATETVTTTSQSTESSQSQGGTEKSSESTQTTKDREDYLDDYLSTLTELIGTF